MPSSASRSRSARGRRPTRSGSRPTPIPDSRPWRYGWKDCWTATPATAKKSARTIAGPWSSNTTSSTPICRSQGGEPLHRALDGAMQVSGEARPHRRAHLLFGRRPERQSAPEEGATCRRGHQFVATPIARLGALDQTVLQEWTEIAGEGRAIGEQQVRQPADGDRTLRTDESQQRELRDLEAGR